MRADSRLGRIVAALASPAADRTSLPSRGIRADSWLGRLIGALARAPVLSHAEGSPVAAPTSVGSVIDRQSKIARGLGDDYRSGKDSPTDPGIPLGRGTQPSVLSQVHVARTDETATVPADAPLRLSEGQARLLALVARKSDVKLELQIVDQHRIYMASVVASLFTAAQAADPNSKMGQILDYRMKQINAADAQLERMSRRLGEMLVAIQGDIDDIQRRIADNIHASIPNVDISERLENKIKQELSTMDEELSELLRTARQIGADYL